MKERAKKWLSVSLAVALLFTVLTIAPATVSAATTWCFDSSSFNSIGKITSTKTVDNLTLIATSDKTLEVKKNSATISGTKYTYCLALGGTGDKYGRAVKVPANGSGSITVVMKSTESRNLIVANQNGNCMGKLVSTKDGVKATYNYSGVSGHLYLYSEKSGINLYEIILGSGSSSSTTSPSPSPSASVKPSPSPSSGSTSGSVGANMSGLSSYGQTKKITSTITVKSGETYDGKGIKIVASGMGDGGQGEGQKPIFKLEKGATLKNVIIGAPGCDGIHLYGNNTVDNVIWEDVGEDALTVKSGGSSSVNYIKNCTASKAYDKLFQCNAECTVYFTNIKATDIGKFVRQNGGTSYKCVWYIQNCEISKVKDSIARTDSKNTKCYYKNLKVSDCDTWWKFPSSSQVSAM